MTTAMTALSEVVKVIVVELHNYLTLLNIPNFTITIGKYYDLEVIHQES